MGNEIELRGEQHDGTIAAWAAHSMEAPFDVITSYPIDSPMNRQAILSIVDSDCVRAREAAGTIIEIGHYICHPVEMRDEETGELSDGIRTILPQTGGPAIAFVSKSIIKAIQRAGWAEGKTPPFDPPIRRRLRIRSTKGPNYIYLLEKLKDDE